MPKMTGRRICLPVTFGTRDNYRNELVDFHIARIGLPYNAILGYPALAQFMAATHPAYNLMKMPGSKGVLTIKGGTKEAVTVLRLAFKTAAAAQPAGAGTPESKDRARQEEAVVHPRQGGNQAGTSRRGRVH